MIASYYGKSSKRWQIKLAQASIQSTAQTVPVTSNRKRKQQKWNFKRVGVRVYSYVYVLPKKKQYRIVGYTVSTISACSYNQTKEISALPLCSQPSRRQQMTRSPLSTDDKVSLLLDLVVGMHTGSNHHRRQIWMEKTE